MDTDSQKETSTPEIKHKTLELGDIIEITAPSNTEIDQQVWAISYIDAKKIRMVHVSTFQSYTLDISESDGGFTDESIQQIAVLCRCKEKGYARQHALLTGTWVDIHFGGEVPAVISGEITNLEEDMIELTTFPERKIIYIDFEYKGLPEDIPIEKIVLRDRPESIGRSMKIGESDEGDADSELGEDEDEPTMEYNEQGEASIHIPEGTEAEPTTRERLQQYYLESNEIVEEEMEEITRIVEVPESERRYTLDAQVIDLTDELLAKYPATARTHRVFQIIYNLIQKFRQLRQEFSTFDDTNNVSGTRRLGAFHKPLVERMESLDTHYRWILPVVRENKAIHIRDESAATGQEDADYVVISEFLERLSNIQSKYSDNSGPGGNALQYDTLIKDLFRELAAYGPPANSSGVMYPHHHVQTHLESVISNTGNFYSTTAKPTSKTDNETRSRFCIQRYSLGQSKVVVEEVRGGQGVRRTFSRKPITPNDEMPIQSLLFFPESFIRYSRVGLPGTNIADRAWLSSIPLEMSRILKKKTAIETTIVSNLTNELLYGSLNEKRELKYGEHAFLGSRDIIKEYRLSSDIHIDETTFHKFLSVVFPQKRLLVDFAKHTIRGSLSVADMIRVMEPFAMYSTDITFSQYKDIRYFVKEAVKTHKADLKKRESEFGLFKTAVYGWIWAGNKIETMLNETLDLSAKFHKSYNIKRNEKKEEDDINDYISTAETLQRIYGLDGGKMYLRLLNKMLLSLITPDKLINTVELGKLDDMTNMEKIRASPCFQRFIAKKYTSMDALRKDNNTDDVFYDSEYDDTPYDILKKYKDKKREMLPELFFEFFRQVLVDKHDCPETMSKELAETIITGKKRVKEGYALMELRPTLPESVDETALSAKERAEIRVEADARKRIHYYKRVANHWVRDETVDETSFIDSNTLLCNINRECIETTPSKVCAPNSSAALKMKSTAVHRMLKEFDSRISMSLEEMENEIDETIRRLDSSVSRSRILSGVMDRKYNDYAVAMGKRAVQVENIESPYEPLRRMIMAQSDFVKRQMDIIRFVETYAREPAINKNENPHWWYCLETNTKLFPNSLYVLARAFVDTDTYSETLDRICAEVGEMSGDGDCIIDKHTHCVLRQIDFSSEEGFDESGFRIISNSVMERDAGEALQAAFRQNDKVFDSKEKQDAYNIFNTISDHVGIREDAVVEEIEDFVLRQTLELMNDTDIVLSEKSYLKRAEKKAKESKDKPIVPYAIYRNQLLFMCVGTTTAIALMTTMPSFKTKKTFPGCVQSFVGYPVDAGEENLGGLKYISCILFKSKSAIEPWNAIEPWSANTILKRMKDFVKDQLLSRADISRLCSLKREYLAIHPEEEIPAGLNVAKWVHFLPPLVDFSIGKTLQGLGSDFESDLFSAIREGSRSQAASIGILQSKVQRHIYGMVEMIRDVVSKKDMLLTTSAKEPFLENACCNEGATNPLTYFIGENAAIRSVLARSDDMAATLRRVSALAKPQIMFDAENTAIQRGNLQNELGDVAIYGAMIHYCNFDRDIPIPAELELVCNEKPAVYDRLDSLEAKIEKMKANGKRYTKDHLERLMAIVNRQNRFSADLGVRSEDVAQIAVFSDILKELDHQDSEIIESRLRDLLHAAIAEYNAKVMVMEERDSADRLNRYLRETNGRMYTKITEFFNKHGNLSDAQYDRLQTFIHGICDWNFDGKDNTQAMYSIHRFILNSVEAMVSMYPAIIQNTPTLPTACYHWGLDPLHAYEIDQRLKQERAEWTRFSGNASIARLFDYIQSRMGTLVLFVRHLPIFAPIVKDGNVYHSLFSKDTVYLLLKYSWYSVLYEYIVGTEDPDIVALNRRELIQQRQEQTQTQKQLMADMTEVFGDDDDGDINIDMEINEHPLAEVQIELGDIRQIRDEVGALMVRYIQSETATKTATNMSYEDVKFKTQRKREKEKAQITGAFERMERDERKVEDMLKQFKIGRWNIGQQKGLFTYSSETYMRQKELNQYLNANEGGDDSIELVAMEGENEGQEVADLEAADAEEVDREYEIEANDIGGLDEDYMDGHHYEEDMEDDWE